MTENVGALGFGVVIVTGSRDWPNWAVVHSHLANACPRLVVQGGGSGADEAARLWAKSNHVPCKTFYANWSALGKRAGPERNTRMLLSYPAARVFAFPLGGPGTRHCIREARRLGHVVSVYGQMGELIAHFQAR